MRYPPVCISATRAQGVRDLRLVPADDLHLAITFGPSIPAAEPASRAMSQMIAIGLRGRGPNADYLAAVAARDTRASVAPGTHLDEVLMQRGLTPAELLRRSNGFPTFRYLCGCIQDHRAALRGTLSAPALAAVCRELLLPPLWNPPAVLGGYLDHRWETWRSDKRFRQALSL